MGLKKRRQGPTVQGINRSTCLHTKGCEDGPGQIPVTLGTCTRTGSSREKAGGNSTRKVHTHGPRHQDRQRASDKQRAIGTQAGAKCITGARLAATMRVGLGAAITEG